MGLLKLSRKARNGGGPATAKSGLRLPRKMLLGGPTQGAAYKRSAAQEESVAKRLGASKIKGSGRLIEKGDVRVKKIMRVECKTTEKKSYRLTLEEFKKLSMISHSAGEFPVYVVEFINAKGKVLGELAIMNFSTLEETLCPS